MQDWNLNNQPRLEVLTGPMFSGKSIEIARRCRSIDYYNSYQDSGIVLRYAILVNDKDTRNPSQRPNHYAGLEQDVIRCSHNNISKTADGNDILLDIYDYIFIDEAQFLDLINVNIIKSLVNRATVIVAGLDRDYLGNPFSEFMRDILCLADSVTKLSAICCICGSPSTFAALISENEHTSNIIIEDSSNKFVPVCRSCYHKFYEKE